MPTYEFERNSYWFVSRGAMAKDVLPESSPIEQLAVTPITNDLRSFVTNSIARLLSLAASDLHSSTDLQDIGFDSIMGMQLMKEIQENFNVRFYPSEAQLNSSLGALLDYLESQVNPPLISNSGSNSRSVAKKQLAFVLSAPRSGSPDRTFLLCPAIAVTTLRSPAQSTTEKGLSSITWRAFSPTIGPGSCRAEASSTTGRPLYSRTCLPPVIG